MNIQKVMESKELIQIMEDPTTIAMQKKVFEESMEKIKEWSTESLYAFLTYLAGRLLHPPEFIKFVFGHLDPLIWAVKSPENFLVMFLDNFSEKNKGAYSYHYFNAAKDTKKMECLVFLVENYITVSRSLKFPFTFEMLPFYEVVSDIKKNFEFFFIKITCFPALYQRLIDALKKYNYFNFKEVQYLLEQIEHPQKSAVEDNILNIIFNKNLFSNRSLRAQERLRNKSKKNETKNNILPKEEKDAFEEELIAFNNFFDILKEDSIHNLSKNIIDLEKSLKDLKEKIKDQPSEKKQLYNKKITEIESSFKIHFLDKKSEGLKIQPKKVKIKKNNTNKNKSKIAYKPKIKEDTTNIQKKKDEKSSREENKPIVKINSQTNIIKNLKKPLLKVLPPKALTREELFLNDVNTLCNQYYSLSKRLIYYIDPNSGVYKQCKQFKDRLEKLITKMILDTNQSKLADLTQEELGQKYFDEITAWNKALSNKIKMLSKICQQSQPDASMITWLEKLKNSYFSVRKLTEEETLIRNIFFEILENIIPNSIEDKSIHIEQGSQNIDYLFENVDFIRYDHDFVSVFSQQKPEEIKIMIEKINELFLKNRIWQNCTLDNYQLVYMAKENDSSKDSEYVTYNIELKFLDPKKSIIRLDWVISNKPYQTTVRMCPAMMCFSNLETGAIFFPTLQKKEYLFNLIMYDDKTHQVKEMPETYQADILKKPASVALIFRTLAKMNRKQEVMLDSRTLTFIEKAFSEVITLPINPYNFLSLFFQKESVDLLGIHKFLRAHHLFKFLGFNEKSESYLNHIQLGLEEIEKTQKGSTRQTMGIIQNAEYLALLTAYFFINKQHYHAKNITNCLLGKHYQSGLQLAQRIAASAIFKPNNQSSDQVSLFKSNDRANDLVNMFHLSDFSPANKNSSTDLNEQKQYGKSLSSI